MTLEWVDVEEFRQVGVAALGGVSTAPCPPVPHPLRAILNTSDDENLLLCTAHVGKLLI